jgi:hypothetical protein
VRKEWRNRSWASHRRAGGRAGGPARGRIRGNAREAADGTATARRFSDSNGAAAAAPCPLETVDGGAPITRVADAAVGTAAAARIVAACCLRPVRTGGAEDGACNRLVGPRHQQQP